MHSDYRDTPAYEPTAAAWNERDNEADRRNDIEAADQYAEKFQRLGRIDALTQVLNELRAYGYPADFQRFIAAKLARESGVELGS